MSIRLDDTITVKVSTIANALILLVGILIAVFINPASEPEHKNKDTAKKVEQLKDLRIKSTPDPSRYSDEPVNTKDSVKDNSTKALYCFLEQPNDNPFNKKRMKVYILDERVGYDGITYVQYVYNLDYTANPLDSTLGWWDGFIKTDCNGESFKPDYKSSGLIF